MQLFLCWCRCHAGRRAACIVAGVLLVGIGVVAGNVIRGAWRNRYLPPALLARQVTTTQVVNFGTMPLAGLAAGWMGSALGLRPTIAIMAGAHALACLAMFWSPIRGLRELPEPAGAQPSGRWTSGSTATPRKRSAT